MKNLYCWLIGPGSMGIHYSNALSYIKAEYDVFGRDSESSDNFSKLTGLYVDRSYLDKCLLKKYKLPKFAIIAVDITNLCEVATLLINIGVKYILLEKPGATTSKDLEELRMLALKMGALVFIAYNRRYYDIVDKLNEIILLDGGLLNFHIDFTEQVKKVLLSQKNPTILNEWLISNSSHVIDLAFFIGGPPKAFDSYVMGSFEWFAYGDTFVGAGVTSNGILFSYNSNWKGPGNWSIEFTTISHRLKLSPLERLYSKGHGDFIYNEVLVESSNDNLIKDGLVRMLEDFFLNRSSRLKSLDEQIQSIRVYESIQKGLKYRDL